MQLIAYFIIALGLLLSSKGEAQTAYPLYPFQCPSGQFVYGFNPVTGGFPGWFCSTPAGGGGGGSLPSLAPGQIAGNATNAQTTPQATNLVGTGSITITSQNGTITINGSGGMNTLAPGLGINLTTYNGTGTAQTFSSGSTLFPQFGAYAITSSPYVLNSTSGGTAPCSSGILCDTSRELLANGSGAVTFKAPNPNGTLSPYAFGDEAGLGYTITTVSSSATFFGCVSGAPTSITVPSNYVTEIADWGATANEYYCVESPQFPLVMSPGADTSGGSIGVGVGTLPVLNSGANLFESAIGYNSLHALTTGAKDTSIGANSLAAVTTGSNNIALGYNSGNLITTGSSNIVLGQTGNITTGSGNILIGSGLANTTATSSNQIDLGDVMTGETSAGASPGLSFIGIHNLSQVSGAGAAHFYVCADSGGNVLLQTSAC